MKAKLTYLGRMISLAPAQLGDQFKETCEVQRTVQVPASQENGWQSGYKQETHTCWWIDVHPETKESVFVTFSGFGPRIHGELVAQGHEVEVEDLVATGLPEKPDVSIYQGIEWRGCQSTVLLKLLTSRIGVVTCPTGWGKCMGKGTPILMFDGTVKPIEQVVVGDRLMGPDSAPRNVLSTCTGREPLYRVVPTKGDPYVVNESHILSLKMTAAGRSRHKYGDIVDVEVRDYLTRSATFKHCAKGWRSAVNFRQRSGNMRLPPYMLGVWLGDGSAHQFAITTEPNEVADEVRRFAKDNGLFVTVAHHPGNKSQTLHVVARPGHRKVANGSDWMLCHHLKRLGVHENKHVPLQYKTASRAKRFELLAGVIDTDGHLREGGGYDLTLVNERLMDDIIFVARSLGLAAYKSSCQKQCCNNGVWGSYWRCTISGDINLIPCRVPHKQAAPRRQKKNPLVTGIKLEPLGEGDYFGFEIDGDHRYLLGDFTVTHNTFLIRQFIRAYPEARVVITVPSKDVADEIFADLAKAMPTQVGFVGDGKRSTKRVQVAITHSLGYCNREANLLIVDEAHAVLTPNFLEMFVQFRRARIFAFTATPDGRSDGADAFLEALFGPVLHHVPYQEAVQSGNVCQLKYRVYPVTIGPNTKGIKQKHIKDRAAIWRNPFRNALISRVARATEQELGSDAQILIMVSTTEHAFVLGQLLPDYTIVHGESLSKDEEKIEKMLKNGAMLKEQVVCTKEDRKDHKAEFSSGRLKRAIATHVWSKGVNFLDLACLIRAEGIAAPIASGQIPGRLSRLGSDGQKTDGLLIDFNDIFSPDFAARSNERIGVYAAMGWIPDPLRGPV